MANDPSPFPDWDGHSIKHVRGYNVCHLGWPRARASDSLFNLIAAPPPEAFALIIHCNYTQHTATKSHTTGARIQTHSGSARLRSSVHRLLEDLHRIRLAPHAQRRL